MRDIQNLLTEKEHAIEQLRLEVEALRSVSPLLGSVATINALHEGTDADSSVELAAALRTVAPLLIDERDEFDPGIRARLISAAQSDFNLTTAKKLSRHFRQIVGFVGISSPNSRTTAK